MKITSAQIIVILLLVIAGFVLFVALGGGETNEHVAADAPAPVSEDDAFLEEVRQLQEASAPDETEALAPLPPVDGDQTLVPVLDIGFEEMDLGTISNSETTHAKIVITNKGKAPLRINDIQTSCACTQGHIDDDKRTVLPGDEVEVEVTVNPFRITGFESHKILTFYTNDPKNPTPTVVVHTQIEPEFVFEPGEFSFGEVEQGDSPVATLHVIQRTDTPFEILGVNTQGGNDKAPGYTDMDLRFEKLPEGEWETPGKAEWMIYANLKPEVPAGELQRFVFLVTDLPRVPNLPVKVTGTITSAVNIEPRFPTPLTLRKSKTSNAIEPGTVNISADNPVEIVDVDYDATKLVVTPRAGGNVQEYHLDIALAPTASPGALQEEVRFSVSTGGKIREQRVIVRTYVPADFGS